MKLHELFEARRRPELNPKISINQSIANRLAKTRGVKAGVQNLFVSFTAIDKLGINPASAFNTPIGIYAYPADYVMNLVGMEQTMDALPFAGDQPFANLFNVQGNIINVATMFSDEVNELVDRIVDVVARARQTRDYRTLEFEIEEIKDRAFDNAPVANPGGRLWYITKTVATEMLQPIWGGRMIVAWTRLFRAIGVDGVVDHIKPQGFGIIHPIEPSQIVLFSINAIANNERVVNKYSPHAVEPQQALGAFRHQETKDVAALAAQSKTTEDAVNLLNRVGWHHFKLMPHQRRLQILANDPMAIRELPRPTKEEQQVAIKSWWEQRGNLTIIQKIKHLDSRLLIQLIKHLGIQTSADELASLVPRADETLQMYIVHMDPLEIHQFANPSRKAIKFAIDNLGSVAPEWLLDMAREARLVTDRPSK